MWFANRKTCSDRLHVILLIESLSNFFYELYWLKTQFFENKMFLTDPTHILAGYSGLSCESCSFGYVRIYSNLTNSIQHGYCRKCDCNGHSDTCNPDTGKFQFKNKTIQILLLLLLIISLQPTDTFVTTTTNFPPIWKRCYLAWRFQNIDL